MMQIQTQYLNVQKCHHIVQIYFTIPIAPVVSIHFVGDIVNALDPA